MSVSNGATAVRVFLLLSLVLGAVGCFEIREEIWVREDGTVRYALDYSVPEFMIVGMTQYDGGDSALAYFRLPPAAVVEGDSVWNREYLDRDLRHFVSERQIASLDRLVALAGRGAAKMDSVSREAARRDSTLRASTKGLPPRRASAIRDSTYRAMAARDSAMGRSDPKKEWMGQVLGGYEAVPIGSHRIRLVHIAFPRPTRAQLRKSYSDAMAMPPAPGTEAETGRKMLAGRTYSFRLHAPHIVSTNGALTENDRLVEWSLPMASVFGDSARALEAVIELKKGK